MDTATPTRSRDRLSEAKRLLLEKRLRGEARPAAPRNAIRRRGGGPVHPMSWAQERLWFLDRLEPGNPFYNIPAACLVSARIDVPTLERAISEVVRRHEALRTVFRAVDGEPRQIVQPPYDLRIEMDDIRGPDGAPADEEAIRLAIARLGIQPFDLSRGPLVRVHLVRVSQADYALLVNVHHIVTDGWSMPIVMREMEELYEAYAHGRPYPLAELPIQYPDYSAWQREYLTGETLRAQLDYWRGHLQGAPTLELPTDRPRPATQSYRGAMYRFVWPASLTGRIRAVAVETGASMNMVIMAAFYLMLHRYSGQDDLVVGTLLGNRNRAETEPLVGFFVNSLPIRARLRDEMPFRELVRQVRTGVLDANTHQDLPFDRIVDELRVERDPRRNPLFQVMYFHHTFVKDVHHKEDSEWASELNIRSLFQETGVTLVDTSTSKFDLTFATLEMDGVLANMCEYASDLWDEGSVARMMEHTRVLLDRACARPDAPLAELSMVSGAERARLLAWGANEGQAPLGEAEPAAFLPAAREVGDAEEGAPALAHADFERRAREAPDATAVAWSGGRMTYAELDARAEALARRLAAAGIRPESLVGVLLPRGAGAVVALLAVLKAGGVYLPLDPAHPPERLRWMLDDAGAAVLLADRAGRDALAGFAGAVVPADEDEGADAGDRADRDGASSPPASPHPLSGAYLVYTSGSTGTPKGVLVQHAEAAAHARAAGRAYGLTPADRVLQFAAPGFDVALEQVLAPLSAGAATVLRGAEVPGAAEIVELLREEGVTVFNPPTAYWHALAADPETVARIRATVRLTLAGGEAMLAEAARRWLAAPGGGALLNVYGPTETVVTSTAQPVDGSVSAGRTTVPVGRPLPGRRAYVLDDGGRLVPAGVPGELHVGGVLARGYLRRPALTAERFVPDPFSRMPGARLYRTGDRARWTEAGALEFLGRADLQVKLRGVRVELGEVEAALLRLDGVRAVAADARGGVLAAYVVAPGGIDPAAARAALSRSLPEHLVPSAVVPMATLPLTPNGKLDRAALPDPHLPTAGDPVLPETETERALAGIWTELLDVDEVGAEDSFFALGGHSLRAMQLVSRVRERVEVELPLRAVFEAPRLRALAARIDALRDQALAGLAEELGALDEAALEALLGPAKPAGGEE